jgi:hypothetical protein
MREAIFVALETSNIEYNGVNDSYSFYSRNGNKSNDQIGNGRNSFENKKPLSQLDMSLRVSLSATFESIRNPAGSSAFEELFPILASLMAFSDRWEQTK